MVDKMSAYSRDASKSDLPTYDAGKFKLPVVREKAGIDAPNFVGLRIRRRDALEDTLRGYEDYPAAIIVAEAEPGTAGLPMDASQYAFVITGMKIVWHLPIPPSDGAHHYQWWLSRKSQPSERRSPPVMR